MYFKKVVWRHIDQWNRTESLLFKIGKKKIISEFYLALKVKVTQSWSTQSMEFSRPEYWDG